MSSFPSLLLASSLLSFMLASIRHYLSQYLLDIPNSYALLIWAALIPLVIVGYFDDRGQEFTSDSNS